MQSPTHAHVGRTSTEVAQPGGFEMDNQFPRLGYRNSLGQAAMMQSNLNPYDSQSTGTSTSTLSLSKMAMAAVHLLAKLIVAVLFAFLVGCAIWAFYNGYAFWVVLGSIGLVVTGALVLGSGIKGKLLILAVVASATIGGWIGYSLYFAMFRLRWFESIFNGKDLGPLGLIVFVFLGGYLTALICEVYLSRSFKGTTRINHDKIAEQRNADEVLDRP